MYDRFANDAGTILDGTINAEQTTLTVDDPSVFPDPPFRIRIEDEYLLVTDTADSPMWEVERAQEGSTATIHDNGTEVWHVLTAGAMTQLRDDLHDTEAKLEGTFEGTLALDRLLVRSAAGSLWFLTVGDDGAMHTEAAAVEIGLMSPMYTNNDTVLLPEGWGAGDLLLMLAGQRNNNALTIDYPDAEQLWNLSAVSQERNVAYVSRLTDSSPEEVTVNFATTGRARLLVFRDTRVVRDETSTPVIDTVTDGSGTLPEVDGLRSGVVNMLIAAGGNYNSSSPATFDSDDTYELLWQTSSFGIATRHWAWSATITDVAASAEVSWSGWSALGRVLLEVNVG